MLYRDVEKKGGEKLTEKNRCCVVKKNWRGKGLLERKKISVVSCYACVRACVRVCVCHFNLSVDMIAQYLTEK